MENSCGRAAQSERRINKGKLIGRNSPHPSFEGEDDKNTSIKTGYWAKNRDYFLAVSFSAAAGFSSTTG